MANTNQDELITELNCFYWKGEKNPVRVYFGIRVDPTKDITEALKHGVENNEHNCDVWVCGVYLDGKNYGEGKYKGLSDYGGEDVVLI